MASRFRTWWQKIRRHLLVVEIIAASILMIVLAVGIIGGYLFNWNWTGLGPYISPPHPKDSDFQRGKTLWDWLQLLIVPLVLAIGGFWLSQMQKIAEQQSTTDNQREKSLQNYLDKMSELLLSRGLRESKPEDNVRNVARARTITILTQLDTRRMGHVFTFLREAGLMSTTANDNVVSLKEADFHAVNWSQADLSHTNLSGADLHRANLSNVNLSDALLSDANLGGAKLRGAYLGLYLSGAELSSTLPYGADFSGADLSGADLSSTYLDHADLRGAHLNHADLRGAHLSFANLSRADLYYADLRGAVLYHADLSAAILYHADLSAADLRGADLSDANLISLGVLSGALFFSTNPRDAIGIAIEKLEKQALSLKDATMPDGSKHP